MGRQSQLPQWTLFTDYTAGLSDRVRCIPERMGSQLRRKQDRGSLDIPGEITPHQLPGTTGALKSFVSRRRVSSILLRLDNVTAIAFINRMGGTHSRLLSDLAVKIWNWSIDRGITIHAGHLPGRYNIRADQQKTQLIGGYNGKFSSSCEPK